MHVKKKNLHTMLKTYITIITQDRVSCLSKQGQIFALGCPAQQIFQPMIDILEIKSS